MHGCIQVKKSIWQKLKLRFVVRGDLQNKEMIGDTWSPIASTGTIKHFLAHDSNNKERVYQLYFIEEFLQSNVKHIVFVKSDGRYG